MVTIPLDGEDEYFVDSASGTPTIPTELPSDVPTIPIEIPTDVPTIPTEVPLDIQTIPTEPAHNATLSPGNFWHGLIVDLYGVCCLIYYQA